MAEESVSERKSQNEEIVVMRKWLTVVITGLLVLGWARMGLSFDEKEILFYVPFEKSLLARLARGNEIPVTENAERIFNFAEGKIGDAVVFGETEAHLQYRLEENLNKESGTICFWMCPNFEEIEEKEGYKCLLSFGIPNEAAIYIILKYGKNYSYKYVSFLLMQNKKWEDIQLNTTSWESDEWHHVAITWAEGKRNLYVDGVLAGKGTFIEALPVGETLAVGSLPGYKDKYFHGKLDELYIFSRSLEEKEIQEIYKLDTWGVADVGRSPVSQLEDTLQVNMDASWWNAGDEPVTISNDVKRVAKGEKSLKLEISQKPNEMATVALLFPQGVDLSKYIHLDFGVYVTSSDPSIKKGKFVVIFIEAGSSGQQLKFRADLDEVPVNNWVYESIDISSFQRERIIKIVPLFYFQGTVSNPPVMTWYFDNLVFK